MARTEMVTSRRHYYLGADVGATKTQVLIADGEGGIVGFGNSGPGNHETVGYAGLTQAIGEAVGLALAAAHIGPSQIAGAGFGVAGYDWPSEKEPTLRAIQALGWAAPVAVVNDTLLGLLAGASEGWGVAVVSGTGCNCRGWDRSRRQEGRVVGRSGLVGEGAGGTELMAKVMEALAHEWTRRGPATQLTPALVNYVGAQSLADLLEGYCEGRYVVAAAAAPLVFQVAAAGDAVAKRIIQWAGCELGELANAVIRQLQFENLEFEVVLVGRMYAGGALLIEPMRQTIQALAPGARLVRLSVPPALGAVSLALEATGFGTTPAIRHNLRTTLACVSDAWSRPSL